VGRLTEKPTEVLLAAVCAAVAGSVSAAASESSTAPIPCVRVPAMQWRAALRALRAHAARLDWIGAAELDGGVELCAYLFTANDSVMLLTGVEDGAPAPSAIEVYPGAGWHQREVAEMFGVGFDDGPAARLLLPESMVGFPLRRSFPLAPRLVKQWPGAAGQDSRRRRARVPGVPPEWTSPHEAAP
jgi:NADH-quinone oxidoreductase subunit C